MKIIRMAVLVAAASVAASKAKEYARENPDQASRTLDKAESFVAGKAGPEVRRHGGQGRRGAALEPGPVRRGLGPRGRAAARLGRRPSGTGFDPSI